MVFGHEFREFVGFYWTFPVPSAGFRKLPKSLDEAAKVSTTIRYQRERVRNWVEQNGRLVDEVFCLERKPDRGTEHIEKPLERALKACLKNKAQLVFVDFSKEAGWRHHPIMSELMQLAPISCLGLPPEPLPPEEGGFDPIEHFQKARRGMRISISADHRREDLIGKVTDTAKAIGYQSGRYQLIAEQLNAKNVRTMNGREWTDANVKQFIRTHVTASEDP